MSKASRISRSNWSNPIEPLDPRRMLTIVYGVNSVLNPSGETYTGTANGTNIILPNNWTANFSPTLAPYSSGNATSASHPKPADSGNVYFAGGPDQESSDFFQMIDLTSIGTEIDNGQVEFTLSGFLGGFGNQNDLAYLFVNFQTIDHFFAGQSVVGPVTAADRGNANGLLSRTTTEQVPGEARFAQVQIHFERNAPAYNDGYADNVSLVFNGPGQVPILIGSSYDVNTRGASFTFSQPLLAPTVLANDLQITNLTTSQTTNNAQSVSMSNGNKTATFIVPPTLSDGNYRFRIPTGSVSGTNGPTNANSDQATWILAGDANRDRTVNFNDLLIVSQNYGQSNRTFTQGNFNYSTDGLVNFNDLLIISQHYGVSVPTIVGDDDDRASQLREVIA